MLLASVHAPPGFAAWGACQTNLAEAWSSCERADWLLWIALQFPLTDARKRTLIAAVGAAMPVPEKRWWLRILRYAPSILEITSDWARGISLAEVENDSWSKWDDLTSALIFGFTIGVPVQFWIIFATSRPDIPITQRATQGLLWIILVVITPPFYLLYRRLRLWAHRRALAKFSYETDAENLFEALRVSVAGLSKSAAHLGAIYFRRRMPSPG